MDWENIIILLISIIEKMTQKQKCYKIFINNNGNRKSEYKIFKNNKIKILINLNHCNHYQKII